MVLCEHANTPGNVVCHFSLDILMKAQSLSQSDPDTHLLDDTILNVPSSPYYMLYIMRRENLAGFQIQSVLRHVSRGWLVGGRAWLWVCLREGLRREGGDLLATGY